MGPNDETEKSEPTEPQDEAPTGVNPTDDPGPMPEGEPV